MMKRKLKVVGTVLALALCLIVLPACRQEKEAMPSLPPSDAGSAGQTIGQKPGKNDLTRDKEDALVREDEEGLVKVYIESGEARIFYDLERWQEVHEINDPAHAPCSAADLRNGPFLIQTQSGNVVDACVGKIQGISLFLYGFTTPTVVLLMEDGSLEWLTADPYMIRDLGEADGGMAVFESSQLYEKRPDAESFSSLAYQADVDGTGEMTIYAQNARGSRVDFRRLWLEGFLAGGTWMGELVPGWDDYGTAVYGFLSFEKGGGVWFDVGEGPGSYTEPDQYFENWSGIAEFIKKPGGENSLYAMEFDLQLDLVLDWWIWEGDGGLSEKISGSYRAELWPEGCLILSPKDGDVLYPVERAMETLYFYKFEENEYAEDHMEGAEQHILAYVQFDKYQDSSSLSLLADEVLWVDDDNAPNGYRIVNETEEWVPFIADARTKYSLWYFVPNAQGGSMECQSLDMDGFAAELRDGFRRNMVLARITVDGGYIKTIAEEYTP